jgi:2-dehydro-3-deoxyphosphooctonate aldolase (KDO 8-P synthase)
MGERIDFTKPFLIAGPCVIESYEHLKEVATHIQKITKKMGIQWVLKSSYDKANRTSVDSFRGPGWEDGLKLLKKIKSELGCLVTSDVHDVIDANIVGRHLDLIQIPAFLCRQTDILMAAARTGRPVNVKKGQFIAPGSISDIVRKLARCGCRDVCVTERGSSFGYGDVVVDFRRFWHLPGDWVDILDVTHSVNSFVESFPLAKAGKSLGLNIFAEVGSTKCDGKRSIPLKRFEEFAAIVA